mmetsp:Transcript_5051/g.14627  ORF Transcript_5051/g.14627 Transcript_5051/m.14627 type:complete len:125 (-) Transcript_5051:1452-1826(-)
MYRGTNLHSGGNSRYLLLAVVLLSSWSAITSSIVVALAMTAGPQRTVLVTGGAGYIGSHTCLELLRIPNNQYKVVVVDNLDNSSEESLRRVRELVGEELGECEEDRIQFRNCDIRDKEGLDKGE